MPLTRPPVRETRRYQTNHSRQCQRQASKWKDMVPPDPLHQDHASKSAKQDATGYGNPKESVDRITRHAEKLPWEKAAPSHNPMGLPPLRAADIAQKA
ncbi:hypothetical protein Lal_00031665 [Lupinus albus]|nr:hypothetical protein Lal_00045107 [Lupinus albus]KAF1855092.1 hypothetical protein Lal_00045003 [Lupinus albus]KAF1855143.1 hypothetical protein Lal_00046613 [Lupinus albus]KAF1855329.1 hypothetical protein Lal_00048025 [Lupinus albus]KAF1855495.1 hypothetical protein Lal_00043746 [Lupinus albus]